MKRKISFIILALVMSTNLVVAQSQAGMVNKGSGQNFDAEQYKIDRMKSQTGVNLNPSKYATPNKMLESKSGKNANGEIWIGGYCRFRPAENSRSRYCEDMSEIRYLTAIYPNDTVRYTDNFNGKGTIPWPVYFNSSYKKDHAYDNLQKQIAENLNDGIPLTLFQKLLRSSDFFEATEMGGKYQFSRSIKVWVKRTSGSEKMDLKFTTQYNFSNGDDNTNLEINDNGSFKIYDNCDNCKHTKNDLTSGKSKSWVKGGWNEIAISKDEFNTVRILINDEIVYQYQIPDIPIVTRYASFYIELPYEWEKKKLMYNVGQITVESYPLKK